MNDKHDQKSLEELSAYLDGEAANPVEVKRRIETNPDAAQLADELSSLSEEVGRLPAPEVHPAFRTRVLAHVREEPRDAASPLVSWPWRALAAIVVIAPFAAGIWTFWLSPPAIPERVVESDPRPLIQYVMEQDSEVVLDELASLDRNSISFPTRTWSVGNVENVLQFVDDAEWQAALEMSFGGKRVYFDPPDTWPQVDAAIALVEVDDDEWLEVLSDMTPLLGEWDHRLGQENWDDSANPISEEDVRRLKNLLLEKASGGKTI